MRKLVLLAILLFSSSCSYTFKGSGTILPSDVRKVYVPRAENLTTEPGLATLFMEAVQDEFERYGVLTVVEDINQADAVLNSRIIDVERNTRTTTGDTDTALQLETQLRLAADLRRVTGQYLWKTSSMVIAESFGTTSDTVVTSSSDFASSSLNADDLSSLSQREISRGQEQEVFENLIEKAAKKIYQEAVAPDF